MYEEAKNNLICMKAFWKVKPPFPTLHDISLALDFYWILKEGKKTHDNWDLNCPRVPKLPADRWPVSPILPALPSRGCDASSQGTQWHLRRQRSHELLAPANQACITRVLPTSLVGGRCPPGTSGRRAGPLPWSDPRPGSHLLISTPIHEIGSTKVNGLSLSQGSQAVKPLSPEPRSAKTPKHHGPSTGQLRLGSGQNQSSMSEQSTSLLAQTVKHLPTMEETQVQSLGQEDLLEKEMAAHYSILAWKIPWT